MPIHDWTRVSDGTFHDFHLAWIAELRSALNEGILLPSYYAQAEQIIGPLGPDVLTLQSSAPSAYQAAFRGVPKRWKQVLLDSPPTTPGAD